MDKTDINAPVQSIERSLLLIHKNIFSIKQYQFPKKLALNLFKESRRTSPLCVRRRLRLCIYPRRPEVTVGKQGVEDVPPIVLPTRTTPFAVHYEKIRNHLCETATNSANIHSLARKYEHLRINQIQ